MKLFQQLLVAPAALGLLAPMAVNAAELNINEVSDYSAASVEAQSFSDVHPSDWAFKALTELADRHGCAVATPDGSISRYEAAALLSKCLGDVAQVTEEESLLLKEFGPEIAVLKGRVDGLEARVGEFEAGQFSSTTTMSGKAAFVLGSVDQDVASGTSKRDALSMNYMYQLNMNTSFSGDDLLYTRIKTGNFASADPLASSAQGTYLANTNTKSDALVIDKIWYQFPVSDNFKFWIGPKIENYYMLASAPSIYKPVLKGFALGGNGTVYGSSTQAGFGGAWTQVTDDPDDGRFAVSAAYTSKGGEEAAADNGLFGDKDATALLTKVEYGTSRWQVSGAVAFKNSGDANNDQWTDGYYSTSLGKARAANSNETAMGLRGYWKPEETGAMPEVSAGVDSSTIDGAANGQASETVGWMVGLGWKDLFVDGNRAGVAFGQRVHATDLKNSDADDGAHDTFSWEAYYTFQVTDGVSVTPAVFSNSKPYTDGIDNTGAVLMTEFRF